MIVALHGGASGPTYWDAPGHPRHSLMRIAETLGYTVITPDRPGYGSSRYVTGEHVAPARQTDLTFGLVDKILEGRDRGAGIFVVGHSQGCVLTLRMAADVRGSDLLGIELSGTGIEHNEQVVVARKAAHDVNGRSRPLSLRRLLWEPAYLYPAIQPIHTPAPAFDGADARQWPAEFAKTAGGITVPVRIVLADNENWWKSGHAALDDMASLFTASRRVVVDEQILAAHNVSLALAATAYHLKLLAFVEECVLSRGSAISNEQTLEVNDA